VAVREMVAAFEAKAAAKVDLSFHVQCRADAGRVVLGLSRSPPWRDRRRGTLPARSRQAPLSRNLTARPFAPRTS
jgi:hypothetical protein